MEPGGRRCCHAKTKQYPRVQLGNGYGFPRVAGAASWPTLLRVKISGAATVELADSWDFRKMAGAACVSGPPRRPANRVKACGESGASNLGLRRPVLVAGSLFAPTAHSCHHVGESSVRAGCGILELLLVEASCEAPASEFLRPRTKWLPPPQMLSLAGVAVRRHKNDVAKCLCLLNCQQRRLGDLRSGS